MPRYWAMRTDKDATKFIYSELKEGLLRQGWGGKEDQDLNIIHNLKSAGKPLNDDQKQSWRGNQRMLPEVSGSIQKGDFILLPNLPKHGFLSIAKVTGGYHYKIHPDYSDYGHIIEVKLLNTDKPINRYSEFVSANLRMTSTNRSRLWNIDQYEEDMKKLILAIEEGKEVSKPVSGMEKLLRIKKGLSKKVEKELEHNFYASEFEEPVEKLLKKIYKDEGGTGSNKERVKRKAGPKEKGADFICSFTDGLGITYNVAVQVKMWKGEARDLRPLNQIEDAYDNHVNISAGVVIMMQDSLSDDFKKKKIELEKKLHIPIEIIDKKRLIDIFLKYIPEIVDSE